MSDPNVTIGIRSTYDNAGFQSAQRDLAALQKAAKATGAGNTQQQAAALARTAQAAAQAATAQQKLATEEQRTAATAAAAAAANQRLATEEQKTAQAATQAALATQKLATEQSRSATAAAQAAAAQARAEQAALRLAQAQSKAADSSKALPRTLDGLSGSAAAFASSMVGVGTAITIASATFNKAKEGFDLRATLEEQRRTVGTLLGDVQKGSQVFTEAAEFGRRYGFTQREMGESAAAAAPLIRTSTTAVEKQLEVLGRLASLNTAEGFSGAVFSTKELASGDIASIVERFNLSRDAANNMKQAIADGADVFQVLDQQLNKMGVTSEVLSNRMLGAAGASRTYAQANEDLSLALGNLAAGPGVKALEFLTGFTNTLAGILSKGDAFASAASGADAIQANLVRAATSYEEYAAKLTAANQQVRDEIGKTDPVFAALVGSIDALTPAQFAYAQSLIATGTAQGEAVAKATALTDVSRELSMIQDSAAVTNQAAAAGLEELGAQILQVASASPEAADGVLNMAAAVAAGDLEVENFRVALEGLIGHQQAVAAATNPAIAAFDEERQAIGAAQVAAETHAGALTEQTQKTLEAQIQAQQLAQFQQTLASLGGAVASGLMDSANAAAYLASQYGVAKGEAADLIEMQARLAQAKRDADAAIIKSGPQQAPGAGMSAKVKSKAEWDAEVVEIKKREAAQAAAIEQARATARARAAAGRAGVRGGGGGGGASTAPKLAEAQIKEHQQIEDAERAHQEKILKIQEDYAQKSAQVARKNEVDKRKSRADFYDDLSQATGDIGSETAQQLSAEYEQAFAKAQEYASKGQHELAREYLKLREEQISADLEYEQALAQAKQEGNEAEAQRLEAIHKMRQDQQAAELALLEQGGDSIVSEREAALAEEEQRYADQSAKIETSAQRKEDALVRSSANSASAVQTWADQVEDATRRATNALNSVPKVPTVTASGDVDEGTATGADTGGGSQGLAGGNRRGLSGGGRAAGGGASGAVEVLSQANAILEEIVRLGNVHKKFIKPIELYRQTLGIATELLTTVADFHAAAAASVAAPIEAATIQRLVDEARMVLDLTATKLVPLNDRQILYFENYQKAVTGSIAILKDMADLRQTLSDVLKNSQPFDLVAVNWLVQRAAQFTALVQSSLVPLTEKQAEAMDRYASGVGATISIIGDLASLRQTVTEAMRDSSPFDAQQIQFLIARAKQFTTLVQKQLLPLTEQQASGLDQYATGVGAAVSIIGGVADLRRQVSEAMANSQPFDAEQVAFLVGRAKQFTDMVLKQLLPLTEDQATALDRYAAGVGASAQIIADMAGLREALTEPLPALDDAAILRLAQDSQRVLKTLERVVIPQTEEQAAAAQRYADTVGAAAAALAAPFELSANLFADYQSPSDAQLVLLANDAQRIADWMVRAASAYESKGLEAAKVYSETVGNTFSAFNEGLVFLDRLRYTDLAIDPQHLMTLEQSTMQTLATMERLGARAAQIPPANIAALQNSAAALTAQMDALIRMTAVPWGNVPAAVAGYNASGGAAAGGGNTYQFNNTFVLPTGSTQQMAQEVIRIVQQQVQTRR